MILFAAVILTVFINDAMGLYMVRLEQIKEQRELCIVNLTRNKCDKPVPLTEIECRKWQLCVERSPEAVAYEQFMCFECFFQVLSKVIDNLSSKSLFYIGIVALIYLLRR